MKILFALLFSFNLFALTCPINEGCLLKEETFTSPAIYLVYAGMSNKDVFSVSGNRYHNNINLFYPITVKEINWGDKKIKILKIDPLYIEVEKWKK